MRLFTYLFSLLYLSFAFFKFYFLQDNSVLTVQIESPESSCAYRFYRVQLRRLSCRINSGNQVQQKNSSNNDHNILGAYDNGDRGNTTVDVGLSCRDLILAYCQGYQNSCKSAGESAQQAENPTLENEDPLDA
jgi:hypothetical protein